MRSRRETDGPFSLFSFQDLITGVTGIMILVVLTLIIDVVSKKVVEELTPRDGPPIRSASAEDEVDDTETMRRTLNALRAEFEAGQANLVDLSHKPEEYASESARLAARLARMKEEDERWKALQEELKQALERTDAANSDMLAKNSALSEEVAELREELASTPEGDVIRFVAKQKSAKIPLLVECSGERLAAMVMNDPSSTRLFEDPTAVSIQSCTDAFNRWATELGGARYAVVVLVKPSAAGYAMPCVIEPLEALGFDVGYEPFEEGNTAVFQKASGG